jgi:squalene synthase HpnC
LSKNQRIITSVAVGHYENFPVASLLLPAPLREPVEAIYRFARSADDLADEGSDPPDIRLARLNGYRAELARIAQAEPARSPLFRDLEKTIQDHALPVALFHDLLDAFGQDVVKKRYAGYAELLDYCRRSANPVGRLLLHLFKRTTDLDFAQSDAICTALQLINFWQDIDLDYAKDGRVYLPRDEMAHHGVSERHVAQKICDEAWRSLLAFQVARTRALMLSGKDLGRRLPGRIGLEIRATVHGGLRILDKIEAAGYDVFRRRPVLEAFDWPVLLLKACF